MYSSSKTLDTFFLPSVSRPTLIKFASAISGFFTLVVIFRYIAPIGYDWQHSFYPALQHPMHYREVSDVVWLPFSLFLLPHGLLSLEWSNAINLALNVVIPAVVLYRYKAPMWTYALIYLSPPFVYNIFLNNIGWIPLLGFALADRWGLVLLAAKPQAVGGAGLIWLKKQGITIFTPLIITLLCMVAIWGLGAFQNDSSTSVIWGWWNISPFPVLVPVGFYLLLKGWREDNAFLAAVATPCLMPYVGTTSVLTIVTIVACKYPREAGFIMGATWVVVAYLIRIHAF